MVPKKKKGLKKNTNSYHKNVRDTNKFGGIYMLSIFTCEYFSNEEYNNIVFIGENGVGRE
jgi:hypothetical protein